MLGRKEKFDAIPFVWTVQYDLRVGYIGHAENWIRPIFREVWKPGIAL